jgi:toxin HigB-1
MIQSFKHRGLKRLYERDDKSKIRPDHLRRVEDILSRLDASRTISEMDWPGWGLHPLKGDRQGFWSVSVSGNWRIVFRFEEPDAFDVDLVDYH